MHRARPSHTSTRALGIIRARARARARNKPIASSPQPRPRHAYLRARVPPPTPHPTQPFHTYLAPLTRHGSKSRIAGKPSVMAGCTRRECFNWPAIALFVCSARRSERAFALDGSRARIRLVVLEQVQYLRSAHPDGSLRIYLRPDVACSHSISPSWTALASRAILWNSKSVDKTTIVCIKMDSTRTAWSGRSPSCEISHLRWIEEQDLKR